MFALRRHHRHSPVVIRKTFFFISPLALCCCFRWLAVLISRMRNGKFSSFFLPPALREESFFSFFPFLYSTPRSRARMTKKRSGGGLHSLLRCYRAVSLSPNWNTEAAAAIQFGWQQAPPQLFTPPHPVPPGGACSSSQGRAVPGSSTHEDDDEEETEVEGEMP